MINFSERRMPIEQTKSGESEQEQPVKNRLVNASIRIIALFINFSPIISA